MASVCPHGKDEGEACSACNETWEAELTLTMSQFTLSSLQEICKVAQEDNDNETQRNCALAVGYVLAPAKASEAALDAARVLAATLIEER